MNGVLQPFGDPISGESHEDDESNDFRGGTAAATT